MTKNALEMMNNMDDDMILSAMETPAAKEKVLSFKKLRWTAVAACIALLMAVPVMAEVFGFTLDFTNNYWEANTNARFGIEEYSEEVRNVKGQEYFVMQDMAEAENFLGIDLPDNAILENAEPYFSNTEYNESGIKQEVHCDVFVGENEGNLLGTHTEAYYRLGKELGENFAVVLYSTVCGQNPVENGGGFGYQVDDSYSESEKYTTPSGRECEIVSFDGKYDYEEMAVTEINRILVSVKVSGYNKESVRAAITAILDAYN